MAEKTPSSDVLTALRDALDGIDRLADRIGREATEALVEGIFDSRRVFVTGKGRSGYVAECFAMRLMQMGFDAHVPGEATCPRIGTADLLIAVSCSGTTMTTVQMARISGEAGATVVAVTADAESPLSRAADHVVVIPVTGEDVQRGYRSVIGPYNNTLFEEALLLYFDALVYAILERGGIPEDTIQQRHTNLE
ncbi:MAG: 6-phospho-3-hexuloisomerase [Candidatus Brocadiia bacterium]